MTSNTATHPHILPASAYVKTWAALLVLTALTVLASGFDFGSGNLIVALVIASVKAALVAAVFMHLAYGNKMNALVLVVSVIMLGLLIGMTFMDTDTRAQADPLEGERPAQVEAPFSAGRPAVKGEAEKPAGQAKELEVPLLPLAPVLPPRG